MRASEIRVWGGKIVTQNGTEEAHTENGHTFALDLERLLWRREGREANPKEVGHG